MVDRTSVSGLGTRLRRGLARRFGIDPRALAALRIALGSLLLVDLLLRARSLRAFYTDAGAVPRSLLFDRYPDVLAYVPHFYSGETWAQATLFVVAGGFALTLLLGYRTRLATVGSLVLVLSLQARNPWVLTGGDSLVRHLLFWSCFLPLGARWSVDAVGRGGRSTRIADLAAAGLLLQVVVVYVVNVIEKLRHDAWIAGDALPTVFGLDRFTILLGYSLREVPELLGALGWAWLGTLLCAPLLLLLTGRGRTLVVTVFASAHLGMALTMDLQLFPFVSVAGLLVFLPTPFWDRIERLVETGLGRVESPTGRVRRRVSPSILSPSGEGSDPPFRAPSIAHRLTSSRASVGRVLRGVRGAALATAIAFVLVTNAIGLGFLPAPAPVAADGELDVTDTRWSMFANPPTTDRWWVAPAERESGDVVDAYGDGPLRWNWPDDVTATHPTTRWRKFMSNVRWDEPLQEGVAGYLCDRWNRTRDDRIESVDLYAVERPAGASGADAATERAIASSDCPPRR